MLLTTTVQRKLSRTQQVTGNKVDKLHADGAYYSLDNSKLASGEEKGIEFVANNIDLRKRDDGKLEVRNKNTTDILDAIKMKDGKWKIPVIDKRKNTYQGFDEKISRALQGKTSDGIHTI